MVLYGQSAGASTVLTYAYAYPEMPIVSGFIASSGGTSASNSATNSAFTNLAQQVGCANLTATAELACMQKVDALVLQNKIQAGGQGLLGGGPGGGFNFRYVVDNITVFANLTERLEKGLVAKGVSSIVTMHSFIVGDGINTPINGYL
jgi:carboxylesterase type B